MPTRSPRGRWACRPSARSTWSSRSSVSRCSRGSPAAALGLRIGRDASATAVTLPESGGQGSWFPGPPITAEGNWSIPRLVVVAAALLSGHGRPRLGTVVGGRPLRRRLRGVCAPHLPARARADSPPRALDRDGRGDAAGRARLRRRPPWRRGPARRNRRGRRDGPARDARALRIHGDLGRASQPGHSVARRAASPRRALGRAWRGVRCAAGVHRRVDG